jgi:hypothetical protein
MYSPGLARRTIRNGSGIGIGNMKSIDYTARPDVRVEQSDAKVESEIRVEAAEQNEFISDPAKKGRICNRIGVSTFCVEDAPHDFA